MCTRRFVCFALLLPVLLVAVPSVHAQKGGKTPAKEMAITFDELPAARTFGETDLQAVTYLLLEALKRHEVKATGFVVGERVEGAYDVLGQWLNDGHKLGNQTWSGQDYNLLDPQQFIADIKRGGEVLDPMLDGFGQKHRYFRFPYLHYGDVPEKRRAVDAYLEDRKYVVCPATIIPEDYLYDLNLTKLGKTPDSVKYQQLMNDYVNSVLDEVERVELLAKQVAGRPVRQILVLRANRLNAVFLNDLLTALHDYGYKFITLDRALEDEVYAQPEAYYGLKGIGYLDMIEQSDPDLIPAE